MNIKNLANSEKPRERLLAKGEANLSNAELIAILLNTGRKGYSSIDIANELLNKVENINYLKQLSIYDLKEIKGIGLYKAIVLKAAFELGIRMHSGNLEAQVKIKKPVDVANYLMGYMQHLSQEHFVALFLNSKNIIIKQKTIFKGTLNSSIIHPREIYCEAIRWSSHALIVAHNHPSGDVTPSNEDIKTTQRLVECGDILGIGLLDHIIIGHNNYLSLVESGYIE
ncbi:RadC family protein [Staphylococcus durrellii]|uniref:RadC family protein n=1 Tax=Staphylococcus durrellii TaxID=2781773 RepID=UPI00189F8AB2|nr:DNA repair protein RadC [Staphylococcus durrellii]MBF7016911.1 DNA repair protein RadC [Staphylococcus durrellii]